MAVTKGAPKEGKVVATITIYSEDDSISTHFKTVGDGITREDLLNIPGAVEKHIINIIKNHEE